MIYLKVQYLEWKFLVKLKGANKLYKVIHCSTDSSFFGASFIFAPAFFPIQRKLPKIV